MEASNSLNCILNVSGNGMALVQLWLAFRHHCSFSKIPQLTILVWGERTIEMIGLSRPECR